MKHKEGSHEEVEDVVDRKHLDELKDISKDATEDEKNDNLASLNYSAITNPCWKRSQPCVHPGGDITNRLRHI